MTRALRLMGHRGACAECPENTLASFQRAVDLGVDALEMDVHLTADGVVVVSHDETGARAANIQRAISAATLAEVRSWDAGWGFCDPSGARPFAGCGCTIPTLEEVLARFSLRLNIDIKQHTPSMIAPLLSLLRRHDAEHRVTLASFSGPVIRQVRRSGYPGETVLARDEVMALLFAPQRLRQLLGHGGDAVQVPLRAGPIDFGSRRFIDRCHRLGLRVDYWTVNDPVVAEVLLERGADGIISDDPRALIPVFDRLVGLRLVGLVGRAGSARRSQRGTPRDG